MLPMPIRAILLLSGLAACAAEPGLGRGASGDPLAARRGLEAQLRLGPVPLEVQGRSPLPEAVLPATAARGIGGLDVRFITTADAASRRLVLAFDREQGSFAACAGEPGVPAPEGGPPRLLAVYCDGRTPLAEVGAVAADGSDAAVERAIWRSTALLFPDDYDDNYGLDLFGMRVRFGASVSR